METSLTLVVVAVLYYITADAAAPIAVDTDLGRIIGKENSVQVNGNEVKIKTFLGIPYAKPPTGERRFRKTELADKFDSDYEAFEFGAACMQPPTEAFKEFSKMLEDCLFLNIYVPEQVADKEVGHAVMVFIHGGGFQHGAGDIYPGESLASTGNVIVVTLNYRLGLFGFLSTGDENGRGNYGLWDQHVALQWVNKHINSFGGDRSRVTLFGESAGASSVIFQGLLPQNKGLITRVISQSGAPSLRLALNSMPTEQFYFIARITLCLEDSSIMAIDCVRNVDAVTLMMALRNVAMSKPDAKTAIALAFFPTVDGDFFKTSPSDMYAQARSGTLPSVGYFRSLDAMLGYNSDDGALMLYNSILYPIPDMDTFMPSREDLSAGMINAVMMHAMGLSPVHEEIKSMFISEFTNWSDPFNPKSIRQQYADMMGNVAFGIPTIEFSRIHANATSSANTYSYVFDAAPSTRLLKTPNWISGPGHADELGFVFGFMDGLIEGFRRTPSPPLNWEWELSKNVQILWSNFAKTGNPNEPVKGAPMWPQYDMAQQQCLKFQRDTTARDTVTIPYCNARHAHFLLEIVPEVMSALNRHHGESSPFLHGRGDSGETCDSDGHCN